MTRRPLHPLAFVSLAGLVFAAEPAQPGRRYVAPGVAVEGDELVLEGPTGEVRRDLRGRSLPGGPAQKLVGLVRRADGGADLTILDRVGVEVGRLRVPARRTAVVTDANVITQPEALHGPVRPHDLRFLSHAGDTIREVRDPELRLVSASALADGRVVTVSGGPGPKEATVVVYGAEGEVRWRYTTPGAELPEAVVTPDDQRLVVVRHEVLAGAADLAVLGAGNRELARHHLPNVYEVVASADSTRIAAAGQEVVVLLDARSGALLWRRAEDLDLVLPGGLRFERGRLVVVAGTRDREARVLRLSLRIFRLADGRSRRAELGEWPLGNVPTVIDVRGHLGGGRRIVFHDRTIDAVFAPAGTR